MKLVHRFIFSCIIPVSSFGKQRKTLHGEESRERMRGKATCPFKHMITSPLTASFLWFFLNPCLLTVHGSPEWRSLGLGSGWGSRVGCFPELPVPPGSWWRSQTDKGAPLLGALAADADKPGGYAAGLALCTCPKEAQISLSFSFYGYCHLK